MTTYTPIVSDNFCLIDIRYNNINKLKTDNFCLIDIKYKISIKLKIDGFILNDIKYKKLIKYKTDNFCLKDINYKNINKYKTDNFNLNDFKYKNLNKYKTDITYLNDTEYKNFERYRNDNFYLTDIQSNIYYKAFVNVIIDTLTRAGIPVKYGQNVKTIDYARWDGVIVRQEEISRDTTYISSYYYNKLSFHLIVASKNKNNYFAYLDAVRQLPLAVKENPYGAVSVVLKPVSGRFDYNVRGIYREEFVLEIQLLY